MQSDITQLSPSIRESMTYHFKKLVSENADLSYIADRSKALVTVYTHNQDGKLVPSDSFDAQEMENQDPENGYKWQVIHIIPYGEYDVDGKPRREFIHVIPAKKDEDDSGNIIEKSVFAAPAVSEYHREQWQLNV